MVSFEYKIITTDRSFWSGKDKTDIESILNDMGRAGRELASVVPLSIEVLVELLIYNTFSKDNDFNSKYLYFYIPSL
jgi:hypothetical protein